MYNSFYINEVNHVVLEVGHKLNTIMLPVAIFEARMYVRKFDVCVLMCTNHRFAFTRFRKESNLDKIIIIKLKLFKKQKQGFIVTEKPPQLSSWSL